MRTPPGDLRIARGPHGKPPAVRRWHVVLLRRLQGGGIHLRLRRASVATRHQRSRVPQTPCAPCRGAACSRADAGLTRSDVSDMFSRTEKRREIDRTPGVLEEAGGPDRSSKRRTASFRAPGDPPGTRTGATQPVGCGTGRRGRTCRTCDRPSAGAAGDRSRAATLPHLGSCPGRRRAGARRPTRAWSCPSRRG